MRKKVSVLIDKEVLQKSHELGVNVSKACENYLKTLNATIEATNNKNGFLGPAFFTKEGVMVRLPGFEPGSSTWQAEVLNQARLQPHFASSDQCGAADFDRNTLLPLFAFLKKTI